MTQRILFWLTFTTLLLSGCVNGSSYRWQHPDGLDSAALLLAETECRKLAENELDRFDYYRLDYGYPFYYDRYRHDLYHRPFPPLHRSYDFHRYNLDYERLFRFCLQAKGWQRIKLDPARQSGNE